MGRHGLPLMRHRRLERRARRDRQRGQGRERLARLLPLYILDRMVPHRRPARRAPHAAESLPPNGSGSSGTRWKRTWRDDRYLRAIHDDGTEIGVKGSGVWEIDALTAAWAVMAGHQPGAGPDRASRRPSGILETGDDHPAGLAPAPRGHEALPRPQQRVSRKGCARTGCTATASSGWSGRRASWPSGSSGPASRRGPPVPRDGLPALAEGLADPARRRRARSRPTAGQPNKQAADMVTTFDPGRMIWNGYTGAAGLDVPPGAGRGARVPTGPRDGGRHRAGPAPDGLGQALAREPHGSGGPRRLPRPHGQPRRPQPHGQDRE